jgi:hypothetical protein
MARTAAGPPRCASSSRLEQPEDSEAVRRYKLAREATQARLATSGRRLRARPLSPAQVRACFELTWAIERLESFNEAALKLPLAPKRLKELRKLVTNLDRAVLTAQRRGLASDPRVTDRLRTLRAVGDRETLRRARRGLEKGVRRPLSVHDLDVFQEISDLIASGKYSNWEKIRRALTGRKIIPPMSRVAFLKLRGRLGFPGRLPTP